MTTQQYVICGGKDTHWINIDAKTLRGAKRVASQTYHCEVGGKIEVAIKHKVGFARVAVKYGFDKWSDR